MKLVAKPNGAKTGSSKIKLSLPMLGIGKLRCQHKIGSSIVLPVFINGLNAGIVNACFCDR